MQTHTCTQVYTHTNTGCIHNMPINRWSLFYMSHESSIILSSYNTTNCRLINFFFRGCASLFHGCLSLPLPFFLLFLLSFSPWPGSTNPIIITITINMIYCRPLSVVYSFPRHRFFFFFFFFSRVFVFLVRSLG